MSSVIVVGLGAMGSAATLQLALCGHHVLGFDHFQPPHQNGSSHGHTRIIRQSYFEDARYVPLLIRAYELWERLQADAATKLLYKIGGLLIGHRDGSLIARSRASAQQFGIRHEVLTAAELQKRYPAVHVDEDWVAVWEANAGYLVPELCIEQQLRLAAQAGADLHFREPIQAWAPTPTGGVTVRTSRGSYSADRLVITAGPWSYSMLQGLPLPLQVTRQVIYYFAPLGSAEPFLPHRLPVYIRETSPRERLIYGFPLIGPVSEGVKIAIHGSDNTCTPETVDRQLHPEEEQHMRKLLASALPGLQGPLVSYSTCLYTMTPDENFIVDRWPDIPQVIYAAGFSGHGFKFASVIGEILADLSIGARPPYDLELFSANRFF